MSYVVDASAVLALLKGETFDIDLAELVPDAVISVVNLSEVVDWYARRDNRREDIERLLTPLHLKPMPLDSALAVDVGMMRPLTDFAGLSFGDRCCLALARRLNLPALTGEQRWREAAEVVGVQVVVFR